jgi:hypothetical protein
MQLWASNASHRPNQSKRTRYKPRKTIKMAKVLMDESSTEEESTDEDTPEDNLIKELQELN